MMIAYVAFGIFGLTCHGLQSIISGGIVQVVHQALDGGTVWCGAAELLNGKAHVLVGAGTTADVAGGTGGNEQSLATDHLFLCQGGGLALVINLSLASMTHHEAKHTQTA